MPLSEDTIKLILDMGNSGKNVADVRQELDKLDDVAQKAGGSTKNLGRGVLELSQAFQDFAQGGVGGVLNNIDGIVQKLGGAAGLAAGISAVAVSAKILYDNWDKVVGLFKDDEIGKQIEKMKELAKATEEVNKANEKIALSVKGKAETDRGSDFRRALAESGGGENLIKNFAGAASPAEIAAAIAKALQGSEQDIGFLRGGNRGLAQALDRPAIERDEAENERRVREREKRREQAQKEDEAENERRIKEREKDRKDEANRKDRIDTQDQRDADRQDKEASRRFNANPDYSKSRLQQMDQMQFARDEMKQVVQLAEQGMISQDQANQQLGELQQAIIQIKAHLDNTRQGQRKIETRMGRLR